MREFGTEIWGSCPEVKGSVGYGLAPSQSDLNFLHFTARSVQLNVYIYIS